MRDEGAARKAIQAAQVPDDPEARARILRDYLRGDKKSEALAVACIRKYPDRLAIDYGDAVSPLVELVTDGNAVLREIVAREVREKRQEIEGPNPSPLERLLVDRIVACWLQVSFFERSFYNKLKGGMSLSLSTHEQKRLDLASRRYLAAIRTLAQVRRLQLPLTLQVALPGATQVGQAGQVNVADQQINVAATAQTRP
jgi:hypothetical protein